MIVRVNNVIWIVFKLFFIVTQENFLLLFRERGKKRGKERKKHWCEKEASISCLPYAPRLGISCAQTRDSTCNLGTCRAW